MKRLVSFFCLCLSLLLLASCAPSSPSLQEQGLALIATLDELAGNEEYTALYSASPEIAAVISGAAAKGSHGTPKAVYAITLPESQMELPAHASQELKAYLSRRTLAALTSQINASAGATALAASSICTVGKTFSAQDAQDVIYLYFYEDAVPVAVTFTTGEDQTVSASATYLLAPDFPHGGKEEIQNFFSDLSVEVSELSQ